MPAAAGVAEWIVGAWQQLVTKSSARGIYRQSSRDHNHSHRQERRRQQ